VRTVSVVVLAAVLGARAHAAETAPVGESLIWFGPADPPGLDPRALLDAVATYTRDLRLAITEVGELPDAPALDAPDAADRGAAILRARGARLGFWCAAAGDGHGVALRTVDRGGRTTSGTVPGADGDRAELYRALALKLRAVLVATASAETAAATAPPPPPAPPTPTAAAIAVTAPPAPRPPPRWQTSVGYRLAAPTGDAPLRHAFAGEVALRLGLHVELGLGTELGTPARDSVPAGRVTVFDLPIAAAVRFVRRGSRWSLGGGVFGTAHLLWATATAADGEAADSFAASAGAGVTALARRRLGPLDGEIQLFAETPFPTTRYWVRGTPVLELGTRVGIGIGAVFPSF
jgi:hypothetical protein